MNSLFSPLHSWQRIWLGHIPGTEEPNIYPASSLWLPGPPHRGLDRSLTGRGQLRTPFRHKGAEALFWAGLRGQISHASSCHRHTPPSLAPRKRASGALAAPLPPRQVASPPQALYAQSLAFGWSSWPQVSMFYLLPHTTAPGWGLVCHPTDVGISRVWP